MDNKVNKEYTPLLVRDVPRSLRGNLRGLAFESGLTLNDLCLLLLERGSTLTPEHVRTNWERVGPTLGKTGDKTALPEKNRGDSGARREVLALSPEQRRVAEVQPIDPALEQERRLVDSAAQDSAPDPAGGDLLLPRVAGRPTGASAPNPLAHVHREIFLPKSKGAAAPQKSREVPPDPAERCPVCFGLLPYHQKGCKNA